MIYCAIIGDIVHSRQIENRQAFQDEFKQIISNVNEKYSQYIASNFTVTLGDEFQGLLTNTHMSYKIIKDIKKRLYPINLVFGVGIGEMYTDFSKEISIGSDGPSYHYAREMVEKAKKKKPSICYKSGSIEDDLINSLIYFIEACESSRTKRQSHIVELYNNLDSQKEVAITLDIKQPVVSKVLKNSFFHEIFVAEESIINFLKKKYDSI